MAKNVFPIPSGIVQSIRFGPQHVVAIETEFFGAPTQITEVTPRVRATVEGIVHKNNHADFWAWIDQMRGGEALAAFPDIPTRVRQGWDAQAAINSSGVEYWRENGRTASFPGGTPTSPWRTANCQANGATSAATQLLPVDGLLASETVKKGTPVRIGGAYRYRTITEVTANGSGEATLRLERGLRSAVADNDTITIPGDLSVFRLLREPQIGASDQIGVGPFSLEFGEVYSSEFTGGFNWVTT